MKSVILAGTHSGAGKTTITIALMNAFEKRGLQIAPFKVGPDYIDPKFHKIATKNNSYNLDTWMNDEVTISELVEKHSKGKDFAVIEGVMGLYDGYDFGTKASTAHIAKILKTPVILIANAKGISTSVCAIIMGFRDFDPEVNIKGIILNNVSSREYYSSMKKLIEVKTGIECVGYFPVIKNAEFQSRQLGLIPVEEINDIEKKIDILSETAAKTIDLDRIIKIIYENESGFTANQFMKKEKAGEVLNIGIARDEAFSFYYEDNLELMEESGIKFTEFSPLRDKKLPNRLDGIYLGGGFPEEFAEELSENTPMRNDVFKNLESGLPCFAECGGLMYLSKGIIDKKSKFYETVGFFNCITKMTEKLQKFGYVEVELEGIKTKAHEFHHSTLEFEEKNNFEFKYIVRKLNKNKDWQCGLSRKNVLAGYPHFHFYSNPEFYKKVLNIFRGKNDS